MASGNGIKAELLDELLKGQDPKKLFEQNGLLDELKKSLAERVLNAELDHHLDQECEQATGNHRNGSSSKTVLTAGSLRCRFRGTDKAVSSPSLLPSINVASRARREDYCPLRARHEHARHSGPSSRALRDRGFP